MKRFRKIYLEISNICNLKCSFCPGTKRPKKAMTEEEVRALVPKLKPWTDFLYFHLMGEPLCHPQLYTFMELAHGGVLCGYFVAIALGGINLKYVARSAYLVAMAAGVGIILQSIC